MHILKKTLAFVSVLAMCLSSMAINVDASTTYLKGDVNCDGVVNGKDHLACKQFLLGVKSANGVVAERLDFNKNGIIDENDYQSIKNIVINSITPTSTTSTSTASLPTQEDRDYYVYNAQSGNLIDTYTLYKSDAPKITTNSTSTYSIIGDDDRYLEEGLIGVVNIGDNGTGFVIDSHTILTAAHCVYNRSENKGCDHITMKLYDGTDFENPSLTLSGVTYHVPTEYVDEDDYGQYDYAIITVNEDLSQYVNFNLGVARSIITNKNPDVYVTGFGWGDPKKDHVDSNLVGVKSTGKGKILSISDKHITYNTDIINGDSGAPLYVVNNGINTVIAIANSQGGTFNSSIRITTDILQFVYNNSNL